MFRLEIRTEDLPNTNQELYRYGSLLGVPVLKSTNP